MKRKIKEPIYFDAFASDCDYLRAEEIWDGANGVICYHCAHKKNECGYCQEKQCPLIVKSGK